MLVSVKLTQVNKKGETSFNASATFNTGNDLSLETITKNVSKFCIDTNKLAEKTKKLGYKGFNNFRKSQPMLLTLEGEDINTVKIELGNFGKFLETTTENKLFKLIDSLTNHVETYANYSL